MYTKYYEGLLITLEGGEGSGKSTLGRHLLEELQARSIPSILVREPGATPLGEKIREILLHREGIAIGSMSELLLFLAARAQNLEENIRPALAKRMVVICDRYNDSSIAYQSAARGLDPKIVTELCRLATAGLDPFITFFLDVDPIVGCERASRSRGTVDSIEKEPLSFHTRVREAYLQLTSLHSERMIRISAQMPLEKCKNEVLQLTLTALNQHPVFKELLMGKNR